MEIKFKEVSYQYSKNTKFAFTALDSINLEIKLGKVTGIVGSTGSGKTTLVQHLNGLLLPDKGSVEVLGRTIKNNEKPKDLKMLRKEVGLVFQFPEYQLFEETIEKDVAFGPMNFNVSEEEAIKIAHEELAKVRIKPIYYQQSPLSLSGGQKRRVAIAGILALKPKVLVLDEPTAGLDPQGSYKTMETFKQLNNEGTTIIMVTHNMEHVLNYCDEVIVLDEGKLIMNCTVNEFFEDDNLLKRLNITPPLIMQARSVFKDKNFVISNDVLNVADLAKQIVREVNNG